MRTEAKNLSVLCDRIFLLNISEAFSGRIGCFFKKTISILLVASFFVGDVALCMDYNDHTPLHRRPLSQALIGEPENSTSVKQAFEDALKSCTPYMLSQVAVTANGILNGYLYGQLGEAALRSQMVMLTSEFFIMGTAMGGLRATSIIAGQLNDPMYQAPTASLNDDTEGAAAVIPYRRDGVAIGNVNKASLLLTAFYGILTIPLFLEAGNIIKGLGVVTDPAIIEQVQEYFNGFVWGAIPTLLLFNEEQFALGLKDPWAAFGFGTLYAGLASFSAYPLVFGDWGPAFGVRGIGYAMSVGSWASWLAFRVYFACSARYQDLNLYQLSLPKREAFKMYVKFSTPLALTNSIGLATDALSSQFITGFSKDAASAYSAASAYFIRLDIILLGYSAAISAYMANKDPTKIEHASSGDLKNAKNRIGALVSSAIGLSALLAVPTLIWQADFITFFAGNLPTDILSLTKSFIWFKAGQSLVNAGTSAVKASLHGLKDITVPFVIDVGTDALSLGSIALVATHADNPVLFAVAGMVDAVMNAAVYSGRLWKMIKSITPGVPKAKESEDSTPRGYWERVKSWFDTTTPLEELEAAFSGS